MYDEAINMLETTLKAFENEDTALARSVFKKDESLDKINAQATPRLLNTSKSIRKT